MHADRGEQLGADIAEDRRHRAAGGQARDEHPGRIDAVLGDDRAHHRLDRPRLAAAAPLVHVLEPVPAALRVRPAGLLGVEHEETVLARQRVHARADREVLGVLRATVQHDEECGRRRVRRARRDEEAVVERAGTAVVTGADDGARGGRRRSGTPPCRDARVRPRRRVGTRRLVRPPPFALEHGGVRAPCVRAGHVGTGGVGAGRAVAAGGISPPAPRPLAGPAERERCRGLALFRRVAAEGLPDRSRRGGEIALMGEPCRLAEEVLEGRVHRGVSEGGR